MADMKYAVVSHLQPITIFNARNLENDPVELVKSWFEECCRTHSKCKARRDFLWLPTRLLDLKSHAKGCIQLIDSASETVKGFYMTLSHRWGSKPSFQLTKDTEALLRRDFDVSRLPRTFQDAVKIAVKLGAGYLWIDSLCIKQDCEEDWERESAQMGDIYKHSFCNIGATGTVDEHSGLQLRETPAYVEVDSLQLQVGGELGSFHAVSSGLWAQLSKEPLNSRAWVLQERHLATSMIHFASKKIFWECFELNACQSFPRGIPASFYTETLRCGDLDPEAEMSQHFRRSHDTFDVTDIRIPILERWNDLCVNYSTCDVTFPKDKLVALSGLAKEFQKSLKARYLAGLWEFHLVPQLLWTVSATLKTWRRFPRPPIYRAPSWSWASVDGPIDSAMSSSLSGFLVEIKEVLVINSGSDPTGAVTYGHIKIRATLHPMKIPSLDRELTAEDLAGNKLWILTQFDHFTTSEDLARTYFCMPVQYYYEDCSKKTGRPHISGLILDRRDDAPDQYMRVGTFSEQEQEKVTSAFRISTESEQLITII